MFAHSSWFHRAPTRRVRSSSSSSSSSRGGRLSQQPASLDNAPTNRSRHLRFSIQPRPFFAAAAPACIRPRRRSFPASPPAPPMSRFKAPIFEHILATLRDLGHLGQRRNISTRESWLSYPNSYKVRVPLRCSLKSNPTTPPPQLGRWCRRLQRSLNTKRAGVAHTGPGASNQEPVFGRPGGEKLLYAFVPSRVKPPRICRKGRSRENS